MRHGSCITLDTVMYMHELINCVSVLAGKPYDRSQFCVVGAYQMGGQCSMYLELSQNKNFYLSKSCKLV